MKSKILKLCPVVLLFLFLGAGCQKDDFEYADENIEIYSSPGLAIYKTRGDYFNLVELRGLKKELGFLFHGYNYLMIVVHYCF